MPTPVPTARQCLTEEAARALDDAVSVAKRRNHAQTTSLHAVSALLSPSFSLLRESLARARSSAYSPRLQFRALELCVGVSLDRLPSSKSASSSSSNSTQNDDFAPPISNSLMAAIKRSQANQRRQPDMYHLHQITLNANTNNNPISISSIKVELKHFVLSILDDPIVSRVFGEAGFRSSDIKLAIIHPPAPLPARWGSFSRCPPLFLCNLMDFQGWGAAGDSAGTGGSDENSRRIGEVMVKKKERNPLLVGVCAKDALDGFRDCLEKGRFGGFPSEIHGVKFVSLEREIDGFVGKKEREGLELKIKEVGDMVERIGNSGPGLVLTLGELRILVKDKSSSSSDNSDEVNELVLKLSALVGAYGSKLWLLGAAADYETYSKFVGNFPSVEKDWDLHPLPITSARSSLGSFNSKTSLMGSFVPFGGFFPTQSEFRSPFGGANLPFARCSACNEKFERELCAVLRDGSSVSVADQYSETLPSWLHRSESDTNKGEDVVVQAKDVKTAPYEHIAGLQKKWDEHCRNLHQNLPLSTPGSSLCRAPVPHNLGRPFAFDNPGSNSCSSGDSSMNEGVCSNSSSAIHLVPPIVSPRQNFMTVDCPKGILETPGSHPSAREIPGSAAYSIRNLSLPSQHRPPCVTVTTDLGLGMIYASKQEGLKNHPSLQTPLAHHKGRLNEKAPGDYKTLFRKLSEVVTWQGAAISRICEIVSCCRSGNVREAYPNTRGNIWLCLLGPDKIGKKKVADALAIAMFGSRDHVIALDLSAPDKSLKPNSLFTCQRSYEFDINLSRITVVDHIAGELNKKPHSVVFLENIDEADPLVQHSMSQAIQTGKFQDSRGREISISNVIFVTTSSVSKDDKNLSPRKEFIKFREEKILEAKNWAMQITIRNNGCGNNGNRVSLLSPKCGSNATASSTKRKKVPNLSENADNLEVAKQANKKPKSSLDLNLPLAETGETDSPEEGDLVGEDSRAWLENFLGQVDGNVEFKPFDFDILADKLLKKMKMSFEESLRGESVSLEVDYEVMVQVLAAAWCSDQGAVEDWIEQVLGPGFVGAHERHRLSSESVVRLGTCEGVSVKEWANRICLPRRIFLNI